jgi:hypothetical protein
MRRWIRHRGKRWYLSIVDDDGIERAHGGYATRREAIEAYKALTDGGYVTPGKDTVTAFLDTWLVTRQAADISPGTRSIERTIVESTSFPTSAACCSTSSERNI